MQKKVRPLWWSEKPNGQQMMAELLQKQGWTCAPPKSPEARAAKVAAKRA